MNEQSLFDRYDVSPLLKKIVDGLALSVSEKKPFQVHLQNLNGSAPAFVLKYLLILESRASTKNLMP